MNERVFSGSFCNARQPSFAWIKFEAMCTAAPVGHRLVFGTAGRQITATKIGEGRLNFTSRSHSDIEDEQHRERGEIDRLLKLWGVEDEVSVESEDGHG